MSKVSCYDFYATSNPDIGNGFRETQSLMGLITATIPCSLLSFDYFKFASTGFVSVAAAKVPTKLASGVHIPRFK